MWSTLNKPSTYLWGGTVNVGLGLIKYHPDTWNSVIKALTSFAPFCPRNLSNLHLQTPSSFMKPMVCADGSRSCRDLSAWLGGPGSVAVPPRDLQSKKIAWALAATITHCINLPEKFSHWPSMWSCRASQRSFAQSIHLTRPNTLQTKHLMVQEHLDWGISFQVNTDMDILLPNRK